MIDLDALDFAKGGGLVTVVAQDEASGCVLMVAHADREALERTIAHGEMHYRSRSRGAWHKGATSGHVQRVASLAADCDGDAVLARVVPEGPACHTGAVSCFDAAPAGDGTAGGAAGVAGAPADPLDALDAVIADRARAAAAGAAQGYTGRLLADRNLRLKKLGEEAAELAIACADGDRERAAEEAADLVYHALVALHGVGSGWNEVRRRLAARRGARAEASPPR